MNPGQIVLLVVLGVAVIAIVWGAVWSFKLIVNKYQHQLQRASQAQQVRTRQNGSGSDLYEK